MIFHMRRAVICTGVLCILFTAIILIRVRESCPVDKPPQDPQGSRDNRYPPESRDDSHVRFASDWCRVRKARWDWTGLLNSCQRNQTWSSKITDKRKRTSGNTSFIARWELQPTGEFSRFFIQSTTAANIAQTFGGDNWRVKIRGTAHVQASVFDLDNGLYEVVFLPMEPGQYIVDIILDYSLCDGYRDPPHDWFIVGNSQGKHQPEGTLGTLDDYLHEPLQNGDPLEFTIIAQNGSSLPFTTDLRALSKSSACDPAGPRKCRFLWDGYGRWVQRTWKPYLPGLLVQPQFRDYSKGKGTLWAYGDSLNFNNYRYNFNTSTLCKKMFGKCRNNINFIYHIKYRIELDTTETDDLDFNVTRVLDHFRSVMHDPDVNHVNSVVFLNMGLHYVMGLTLERYKDLIQRTIDVVKETARGPRGVPVNTFKGRVIWKTTTAINKQKAKSLQATKWRFCTSPRVALFNAYATSAMCQAGIDIVDMYPITDTYPDGTYDVVHYRPPASQPLVPLLINYLRQESDDEIPYDKLDV